MPGTAIPPQRSSPGGSYVATRQKPLPKGSAQRVRLPQSPDSWPSTIPPSLVISDVTARRPQRKNRGEQASSVWRMNAPRSPRGTASSPQAAGSGRARCHPQSASPSASSAQPRCTGAPGSRTRRPRRGRPRRCRSSPSSFGRHDIRLGSDGRRATAAGRPRRSKCTCHRSLVTHGSPKWHSPDPTPPPSVLGLRGGSTPTYCYHDEAAWNAPR